MDENWTRPALSVRVATPPSKRTSAPANGRPSAPKTNSLAAPSLYSSTATDTCVALDQVPANCTTTTFGRTPPGCDSNSRVMPSSAIDESSTSAVPCTGSSGCSTDIQSPGERRYHRSETVADVVQRGRASHRNSRVPTATATRGESIHGADHTRCNLPQTSTAPGASNSTAPFGAPPTCPNSTRNAVVRSARALRGRGSMRSRGPSVTTGWCTGAACAPDLINGSPSVPRPMGRRTVTHGSRPGGVPPGCRRSRDSQARPLRRCHPVGSGRPRT